MEILKKAYGHLGKLHKDAWEHYLHSNQGLFRRAPRAPGYVIGPTVDRSGRVIGDMLTMETNAFYQIATKEQHQFYEELMHTNPAAAKEYMLTVGGAIERWKRDVKWLKIAVRYLEKEEKGLEREEHVLHEEERIHASIHLPPILKRHFPQLFNDIDFENRNVEEIVKKIREVESRVKEEEHYIRNYVRKLERDMPFLFE